ncbi:MAG: hypothetical protein Q9227_002728 [Pyrenula ochraceoflavens]
MAQANVHISRHPCLRAKLSQLRSASRDSRETRTLVHEISLILGSEALALGLQTQTGLQTNQSSLGYEYAVETISPSKITLVPILRSGLGMVDAVQTILPEAVSVHHLGLFRDPMTLQPVEYYNNLPFTRPAAGSPPGTNNTSAAELAIILDPVIATGGTSAAAVNMLKDWGVSRIIVVAVLASKGGLERVAAEWPEATEVWVAGVDEELNDKGMIKPGLGDIGDRLFMTMGK